MVAVLAIFCLPFAEADGGRFYVLADDVDYYCGWKTTGDLALFCRLLLLASGG